MSTAPCTTETCTHSAAEAVSGGFGSADTINHIKLGIDHMRDDGAERLRELSTAARAKDDTVTADTVDHIVTIITGEKKETFEDFKEFVLDQGIGSDLQSGLGGWDPLSDTFWMLALESCKKWQRVAKEFSDAGLESLWAAPTTNRGD